MRRFTVSTGDRNNIIEAIISQRNAGYTVYPHCVCAVVVGFSVGQEAEGTGAGVKDDSIE